MQAHPKQVERGALAYYLICMPCHGDWGQGLADGWRAEWGEDQNCWQSKCHASNHPPWGFELPHNIPAVLGSSSLLRFETAADLSTYIQATMPWWNPGVLSTDQGWEVTAYLMHARGELDESAHLEPGTAAVYRLHAPARQPPSSSRAALVLALPLLFALFLLVGRGSPAP